MRKLPAQTALLCIWQVDVYRGRDEGWVAAVIAEVAVLDVSP